MNFLTTIKQRWDFTRILRLVIGVTIIGQSFILQELLLGIGGALLAAMAILNIGCCGTRGCAVSPPGNATKTSLDETRYEDVKSS